MQGDDATAETAPGQDSSKLEKVAQCHEVIERLSRQLAQTQQQLALLEERLKLEPVPALLPGGNRYPAAPHVPVRSPRPLVALHHRLRCARHRAMHSTTRQSRLAVAGDAAS